MLLYVFRFESQPDINAARLKLILGWKAHPRKSAR